MPPYPSRRQILSAAILAGATGSSSAAAVSREKKPTSPKWRYCLNTSTIAGQKLSIEQQVQLAGKVGYDGIEPWIRDIETYIQQGGNLNDLKQQIVTAGLRLESAIGFAPWIVNDPLQRQAGLEQARREMEWIAQLGGTHIAAPPAGGTKGERLDLNVIAERYQALLNVGANVGVIPQLEVWGFSLNLSRLGEVAQVAIEAGHPHACLLLDVYHLYKGGSGFMGLRQLAANNMHAIHLNDYPANISPASIGDQDRIYPGEGVAPLENILQTLAKNGFQGALSLELFNRQYWQQPAEEVARTGLQKMKSVVASAIPQAK